MSKLRIVSAVSIGLVFGLLVIQPLIAFIDMYHYQRESDSLLNYLASSYSQVLTLKDWDQMLESMLFGFLGVSLVLMVDSRKKIFLLIKEKDNWEGVHKLIAAGENQQVEFKSTLRWDIRQSKPNQDLEEIIGKTIAGFMNTGGGNLFIGVDDDGQPLGLMKDYCCLKKPGRDGFEQYIMQLVSTKLGTEYCPLITVAFHQWNDQDICHLMIKASRIPVYLRKSDRSHFYIRTGNSTRELDIPQALNYIEEHLSHSHS